MMMDESTVRKLIKRTEEENVHILNGTLATVDINAPRALLQIATEARLQALYEILNEEYRSKLKGVN